MELVKANLIAVYQMLNRGIILFIRLAFTYKWPQLHRASEDFSNPRTLANEFFSICNHVVHREDQWQATYHVSPKFFGVRSNLMSNPIQRAHRCRGAHSRSRQRVRLSVAFLCRSVDNVNHRVSFPANSTEPANGPYIASSTSKFLPTNLKVFSMLWHRSSHSYASPTSPNSQLERLPFDVRVRLLASLDSFASLRAAVLSCKAFYEVYHLQWAPFSTLSWRMRSASPSRKLLH